MLGGLAAGLAGIFMGIVVICLLVAGHQTWDQFAAAVMANCVQAHSQASTLPLPPHHHPATGISGSQIIQKPYK